MHPTIPAVNFMLLLIAATEVDAHNINALTFDIMQLGMLNV